MKPQSKDLEVSPTTPIFECWFFFPLCYFEKKPVVHQLRAFFMFATTIFCVSQLLSYLHGMEKNIATYFHIWKPIFKAFWGDTSVTLVRSRGPEHIEEYTKPVDQLTEDELKLLFAELYRPVIHHGKES